MFVGIDVRELKDVEKLFDAQLTADILFAVRRVRYAGLQEGVDDLQDVGALPD